MAHLLRGKQAGIQGDLSAGLISDLFVLDDLERYGINSQISCMTYDPVQSLLAIGTRSTQFGPGQIYVFGQRRVQVILSLPPRGASVEKLQFCAEKLICLDSKHDLSVFSLELKTLLASHSPPGVVTSICVDPMLDYALLGMQTGEILAYDLDRESLAPFRIPNMWQEIDSRARVSPIVGLCFHPRDIGTLLIGYSSGATIYSFKLNKALRFFAYEIPRGAPGGDGDRVSMSAARRPRLTQVNWHPTGTFILTGYDDGSIVFWDALKDGRMLMARTLTDTHVATPGARLAEQSGTPGVTAVKEPLYRISWCANQDPEDTAILLAGGQSTQAPTKGLTLFEMGRTPIYATSSWDQLAAYFEAPKRQRILPTPPGAEVVDFCLLPRSNPHFAGAHDPIAVLALLASGELVTLTFPTGMPVTPTNQLHVSLTLVHPIAKSIDVTTVGRERWLGMTERRQQGPSFLNGGLEQTHPMRRFEGRNIISVTHADGCIRLWDVGHADELENDRALQIDVARAVGRFDNINITYTSLAGTSGEMAVGLASGEVAIFRWGSNSHHGKSAQQGQSNRPGGLTSISDRAEPALTEGLMPVTLLDQGDGPVTCVRMSEVGFVAAGFAKGSLAVIDMRGPAIIYTVLLQDILKSHSKIGSLRGRASSSTSTQAEVVMALEFSIMMLDGDDYSSILLHVGTDRGHVSTFKIVPDPSGRYTVQPVGCVHLEHPLKQLKPIYVDTGKSAHATQRVMGDLRAGVRVNGALVAITTHSIHVFRPATSKGAHKSFDSYICDTANVVRYQDQGHAVVGLFGDGYARAYSIPALREIAALKIDDKLDVRRFSDAVVTPSGVIVGFKGPSELTVLDIFGTGEPLSRSRDKLFNPEAIIPPRPTISAVQWVTGTQYITPADMDILIGGPDRPPSKRMIAQARADEEQRRRTARTGASSAAAGSSDETYWGYMQRQIQERTEKLGLVGDSMENLEQNSASWASEVNKFVSKQKRGVATSILKAKFGL